MLRKISGHCLFLDRPRMDRQLTPRWDQVLGVRQALTEPSNAFALIFNSQLQQNLPFEIIKTPHLRRSLSRSGQKLKSILNRIGQRLAKVVHRRQNNLKTGQTMPGKLTWPLMHFRWQSLTAFGLCLECYSDASGYAVGLVVGATEFAIVIDVGRNAIAQ